MTEFVIADSQGQKNDFLVSLAEALAVDGCRAVLWSAATSSLSETWRQRGWLSFKTTWPKRAGSVWPWRWLWSLGLGIRLILARRRTGVKTVVCLGSGAKLLISRVARRLKFRVIWLELPNFRYEALGRNLRRYQRLAALARLVCFSVTSKLTLSDLGVSDKNLTLIWPGIDASVFQNQISMFQNLARQNYTTSRQKFFTIGTILDFTEPQRSEVLMRALAEARVIVPHLRLIVIGDGEARQQARWLSRQLGLANAVWLVGSQSDLKKWYANFDLFIVSSATPGLDDFVVALAAMVNGVPVIAPRDLSLEDCFLSGQAGWLLSLADPAELSEAIIKLEQDTLTRKELATNARRVAQEFFALSRVKEEFKKVLNG